jgi:hypothetical protein
MMARYRLRYFFEPGANICFWAANDAARERFGYPIDSRTLPLAENTWRRLYFLASWYDTSIDWNYPPDPSPWDHAERERFNNEAQKLLAVVREELGSDFEVVDESQTSTSA